MKIEINNNRIFLKNNNKKTEIHPIWLRERANGQKYLDKQTDQRLFDPSFLENINIKNALIKDNTLELNFNDGANSKYEINKIASEFLDHEKLTNTVKQKYWDSSLKENPIEHEENVLSLTTNPTQV